MTDWEKYLREGYDLRSRHRLPRGDKSGRASAAFFVFVTVAPEVLLSNVSERLITRKTFALLPAKVIVPTVSPATSCVVVPTTPLIACGGGLLMLARRFRFKKVRETITRTVDR
jgi:hypothetical protein